MPYAKPLPDEVVTRAEAAVILNVNPRRVTKMRGAGRLQPATTPHRRSGLYWREQVEALADEREARAEREANRRRATRRTPPARRSVPELPPDQDATFEELMAAAEWTRANSGPFVDTEGAAEILGVSVQYVGRLAAQGRLPWLPTGRSGGAPTRVQIEVIARGGKCVQRPIGIVPPTWRP